MLFSRIFCRARAVQPAPPRTRRRNSEARVRDRIAAATPGSRTEVPCSSGVVDILTPREIVEVKRAALWKAAMGQVLAYSSDFPGRRPRVHLFGPDVEHFRLAAVTCERFGVRLTATDGDGEEVDVWAGSRRSRDPDDPAPDADAPPPPPPPPPEI
eukprot:jgi/Tetstr1/464209/TSEL_009014.t1